jgi:hypothetical protein
VGEEQEPGARIQDSGFRTDKTKAPMLTGSTVQDG